MTITTVDGDTCKVLAVAEYLTENSGATIAWINDDITREEATKLFKESNGTCDICHTNRDRRFLFLVKKDNEYITVGRNCLAKSIYFSCDVNSKKLFTIHDLLCNNIMKKFYYVKGTTTRKSDFEGITIEDEFFSRYKKDDHYEIIWKDFLNTTNKVSSELINNESQRKQFWKDVYAIVGDKWVSIPGTVEAYKGEDGNLYFKYGTHELMCTYFSPTQGLSKLLRQSDLRELLAEDFTQQELEVFQEFDKVKKGTVVKYFEDQPILFRFGDTALDPSLSSLGHNLDSSYLFYKLDQSSEVYDYSDLLSDIIDTVYDNAQDSTIDLMSQLKNKLCKYPIRGASSYYMDKWNKGIINMVLFHQDMLQRCMDSFCDLSGINARKFSNGYQYLYTFDNNGDIKDYFKNKPFDEDDLFYGCYSEFYSLLKGYENNYKYAGIKKS